jgi:hypothetical protein
VGTDPSDPEFKHYRQFEYMMSTVDARAERWAQRDRDHSMLQARQLEMQQSRMEKFFTLQMQSQQHYMQAMQATSSEHAREKSQIIERERSMIQQGFTGQIGELGRRFEDLQDHMEEIAEQSNSPAEALQKAEESGAMGQVTNLVNALNSNQGGQMLLMGVANVLAKVSGAEFVPAAAGEGVAAAAGAAVP